MRKVLGQVVDFSKTSHAAATLFAEICIGITAVIGSLLIFLKLGEDVLSKEVISFDEIVTQLIYVFRTPFMTDIMRCITFLGGDIFLSIASIVTILLLLRKHTRDAFVFSFILLFGVGLNILLKNMFQRPRPTFLPLINEPSYSFPSGHSMNSFVFFMSLSYFIFRNTRNKKLGIVFTFLSGLLVLGIGVSRIYLGAHYPSDVVAGFAAGLLWFVIVLLFEKTVIIFRLFREYEADRKY